MSDRLVYNSQTIVPVVIDGVGWIRESDIALSLELDPAQVKAARLRYRARFSAKTCRIIQMDDPLGPAMVRLYTTEGATRLAKLLLGKRAESFNLWVDQALSEAAEPSTLLAVGHDVDGHFARGYESLACFAELIDELSIHRPQDGGLDLCFMSTLLHTIRRELDVVHRALVESA